MSAYRNDRREDLSGYFFLPLKFLEELLTVIE